MAWERGRPQPQRSRVVQGAAVCGLFRVAAVTVHPQLIPAASNDSAAGPTRGHCTTTLYAPQFRICVPKVQGMGRGRRGARIGCDHATVRAPTDTRYGAVGRALAAPVVGASLPARHAMPVPRPAGRACSGVRLDVDAASVADHPSVRVLGLTGARSRALGPRGAILDLRSTGSGGNLTFD